MVVPDEVERVNKSAIRLHRSHDHEARDTAVTGVTVSDTRGTRE